MRRHLPLLLAAGILAACTDDPTGVIEDPKQVSECPYLRSSVNTPSGISSSLLAEMCWREAIVLPLQGVIDINESGKVLGTVPDPESYPAHVYWTKAGGVVRLEGSGRGKYIRVMDINNNGEAVGLSSSNEDLLERVTMWNAQGKMIVLNVGPGLANSINDAGMIVGWAFDGQKSNAFMRLPSGEVIHPLKDADGSEAVSVNNRGEVVGNYIKDGVLRGFYWTQASGLRDMGTIKLEPEDRPTGIVPYYINDMGVVIGRASNRTPSCPRCQPAIGTEKTFTWTSGGGFQDITSSINVEANARISVHGEIIGLVPTPIEVGSQAATWAPGTGVNELRVAGKQVNSRGRAINSYGDVLGEYMASDWQPVIWTWTPERYK